MIAEVRLWNRRIGAVSLVQPGGFADFEYDPAFAASGIEVSPLAMPLGRKVYSFPELPVGTFHGLPGLLSDSLPDRFGNALIDAWLAEQGRRPESFTAVERLCYTGDRGMGALEFVPALGPAQDESHRVEIDMLVELASRVLDRRRSIAGSIGGAAEGGALREILRVGTSAGGARAKAVIAWNPETNEVRSGQVKSGSGFEYWLLKFDGVSGNRDKELEDPKGYGAIEYAYYLMAVAAGIEMSQSRLLEENGRRHFMTRRFDRTGTGSKIHAQTLGALGHFDFNSPGACSYEQALLTARRLGCGHLEIEQLFRRMAFNVVARNQDDHVKNIAFLMSREGNWSLAPAFDMTYSYNPDGIWTSKHQMTLNRKRDDFRLSDFAECGRNAALKRGRARSIVSEVTETVANWRHFAASAGLDESTVESIAAAHRLSFGP